MKAAPAIPKCDLSKDAHQPLRVLQINAVYGTSSTGRNCLELDEAAAENGIKMYTAYAIPGPFNPSNGYVIGNQFDRKLHAFLSRLSGKQCYASDITTMQLLLYIERIKPDVIHLNNLHSNYINIKLLLRYIANHNIPTVITLHDCWFYTGRCVHYTLDKCQRWKNSCGQCPRLKKDNPSWFFDQSAKMLEDKRGLFKNIKRLAVVGVSDWITNEAKQSILANSAIIQRIYNWVDLDIFKADPESRNKCIKFLPISEKTFVIIGIASSWSEGKGLGKFVELARRLTLDEKILLVGSLPPGFVLPENIIHIKETSDVKELALLYSAADVFVSFSKEETFGKVTAEALASGIPVIVNNMTANPELVGPQCGYVVNTDNTEDVYNKIHEIKVGGRNKFVLSCRSFSVKNFNKKDNIKEYFALYHKIFSANIVG